VFFGRYGGQGKKKSREKKAEQGHLVVDQAPLLKKGVNASDGAHISHKISAAGSHGQVLRWIQAVGVDHEIAIFLVNSRVLGLIFLVEKLRQGLPFGL